MLTKSLRNIVTCRGFSQSTKNSIGVIGVPFSKGQSKVGVEDAPKFLRNANLVPILKNVVEVKDYGDLDFKQAEVSNVLKNMNNLKDFLGCSVALISKVQEVLKENNMFLAIGGDHSISFGSIGGHLIANPKTSLIWIDAHPDINVDLTSKSGNIHGMPVAFLLKEMRKYWTKLNIDKIAPNCLSLKELVYIGLRDIDPHEAYILNKLGIQFYAMDAVDKYGIAKIIEMSLDSLNLQNKLHVSFDIDALDVSIAPSTGTPVYGGLTLREGLYIMETLCDTNRVEGIDLVELNPHIGSKDEVHRTCLAGIEMIKAICGYKRSGNVNVFKDNILF